MAATVTFTGMPLRVRPRTEYVYGPNLRGCTFLRCLVIDHIHKVGGARD